MTYPSFTAGEVLRAQDMNAVGLWLVKSQTIGTGVSSVTVSNAFSADYDNYKVVVSGGTFNSSAAIILRLGGSTSGYYGGLIYVTYNVGTVAGAAVNGGTGWIYAGVGTTNTISADFELLAPFSAKTTTLYAQYGENSTTGSAGIFNGFHNSAVSYTDFTMVFTPATATGGTISVYGYKK